MVFQHYGLREQPFGVTPDPRYLCPTDSHREALVHGRWHTRDLVGMPPVDVLVLMRLGR